VKEPVVLLTESGHNRERLLLRMARRRFQETSPLTSEQGLLALILMGTGLTIGGVVATCFLALSEGASQGAELWLSGKLSF
jgi:hypothetical protein